MGYLPYQLVQDFVHQQYVNLFARFSFLTMPLCCTKISPSGFVIFVGFEKQKKQQHTTTTVDGRNPAPVRLAVYPVIYRVFLTSKRWLGMGFLNHELYPVSATPAPTNQPKTVVFYEGPFSNVMVTSLPLTIRWMRSSCMACTLSRPGKDRIPRGLERSRENQFCFEDIWVVGLHIF